VPWTAHSYNVAFSDEIGHWDYCSSVDPKGNCQDPGKVGEADQTSCFPASESPRIKVGGCIAEDLDFDGTSYLDDWPGTGATAAIDKSFHPAPITFDSPLLNPATFGPLTNFEMTTFEADTPSFEPGCDTTTGFGCINPPAGAAFYPFYSIGNDKSGACSWRFGGSGIAGTSNDFGGMPQYGNLLELFYPSQGAVINLFDDFQGAAQSNPCEAPLPALAAPVRPLLFGSVKVGKTSGIKELKISNPSTIPITLNGIAVPENYHLVAGKQTTCANSGVLAPGGKCEYGLTLTPLAAGPDDGTATIATNASQGSLAVSLVGSGK